MCFMRLKINDTPFGEKTGTEDDPSNLGVVIIWGLGAGSENVVR